MSGWYVREKTRKAVLEPIYINFFFWQCSRSNILSPHSSFVTSYYVFSAAGNITSPSQRLADGLSQLFRVSVPDRSMVLNSC